MTLKLMTQDTTVKAHEYTDSISISDGSAQSMAVRARPEQSTHKGPHDTHALPPQDPCVEFAIKPGDSPEPEPEAGGLYDQSRHYCIILQRLADAICAQTRVASRRSIARVEAKAMVQKEDSCLKFERTIADTPTTVSILIISFRLMSRPRPPPTPQLHLALHRSIA